MSLKPLMTLRSSAGNARAFLLAFEALGKVQFATVPRVVCAAFAAELAIKSLLERNGIAANSHDVQELTSILQPSEVARIATRLDLTLPELDARLRLEANTFDAWRYSAEMQLGSEIASDDDFLAALARAALADLKHANAGFTVVPLVEEKR